MPISQRQIHGNWFDSVSDAEAEGRPTETCFIKETQTHYYFCPSYPAAIDHLSILATQRAGFTRWVGYAGRYAIDFNRVNSPKHTLKANTYLVIEEYTQYTIHGTLTLKADVDIVLEEDADIVVA